MSSASRTGPTAGCARPCTSTAPAPPTGTSSTSPATARTGSGRSRCATWSPSRPDAHLRLWRFLADLDLVTKVAWGSAPLADPLPWALVEPRAVTPGRVSDQLWVRVLDVPDALEARGWGAEGTVVLDVDDALGHAAGRWQVVVSGGRATVSRTDAEPGVRLEADTLGALYLGDVDVPTLRAAGRLTGDDAALATWAAMSDVGPAPYCVTDF